MIKNILGASLLLAAFSTAAFAATAAPAFYVEQDAKTKKCMVSDKAADGKMMMDVGTKAYDSKENADKAMGMLKVCGGTAMAPAAATGFYVEQDAKTKKCMVSDKAADGKMMMDVGTKMYDTQGNADKAMAMLKVCK